MTGPSVTAPVPALKPDVTPPGGEPPAKSSADKPPSAPQASKPTGIDAASAKILTLDARPVAVISGQGTWDDGFKTIMGAVQTIQDALVKADIKSVGNPMAEFRETDDNGFKFDVMVPVDANANRKAALPSTITFSTSPAGKVLKFEHRDAYDAIDTTYEAITAYLDQKGFDSKNMFIEEYLNPMKSPDDSSMRTDIYVFVK